MIGIFIKIPFHAQIRRADRELAAALVAAATEAAAIYGARAMSLDESFFLGFDETLGCAALRAAEAARWLDARLERLAGRLHGFNIIIGAHPLNAEELHRSLKRSWHEVRGDGLFANREAATALTGYLEFDEGADIRPVRRFCYAMPALPAGYSDPAPAGPALERFIDEVGRHGIGETGTSLLLAIGPGDSPERHLDAALRVLYGEESVAFQRLRAAANTPAPFGPFLTALAAPLPATFAALLSAPEKAMFEELTPVADFLAASPYRVGYSAAIRTRVKLLAATRLKLYARSLRARGLPAFLILEGLERFPQESVELVRELSVEGLGDESLIVLAAAERPPLGLGLSRPRILAAPPPAPSVVADAARRGAEALASEFMSERTRDSADLRDAGEWVRGLASLAEGDPYRLRLALALAKRRSGMETPFPHAPQSTEELLVLVLETYPPEYAELLIALGLAEDVLDDARTEEFLSSAGFMPGIRPLLYDAFAELGLLTRGALPRLRRPEAPACARKVLADEGAAIERVFVEHLVTLHAARRILPSVALYRHITPKRYAPESVPQGAQDAPRIEHSRFLLDCIVADALYGPSEPSGAQALDAGLAELGPFLKASSAADAEEAAAHLAALEAKSLEPGADPLTAAVAALARAEDEYARGRPLAAASLAKPALIGLHGLAAARAEARAHRLLGLAALAQTQVQEGADYLANAYDIASGLSDPYECFQAAFADAGAELVLGDLRRSEQRAHQAQDWARRAFRADWEAACDFLLGRLDFELGDYEKAAERFGAVRAAARIYGETEAARRAEIWAGRASAYRGASHEARELLMRHSGDAEALFFLAECTHWEGNFSEAADLAVRALSACRERSYFPAEALVWDSGFAAFEARALGFGRSRSYLADQIAAFAAFAQARAKGSAEFVLDIAAKTREERLALIHPEAHRYHFYCYLVLVAIGSGPLDPDTVLSKAFKALQTRSARLEDAALKDKFLEQNRWNRELVAAARQKKLL